jgi:uncharacterized OsmC-like protein
MSLCRLGLSFQNIAVFRRARIKPPASTHPRTFATQHDDTTEEEIPEKKFQKRYELTGQTMKRNKSGVTVTTNTGHVLSTDLPVKMGGQNTAPQPVEVLLTALAGCTQATALFVGRQMTPERLILDRLEFDWQAIRDERGALHLPLTENPPVSSRLQRVSGTVTVFAAGKKPISTEQMTFLKKQTELRCPVANMFLASGCEMDVEWTDGGSTC